MKTTIIYLLCASLLLQGCYSYSTITGEDHGRVFLKPDQNIRIVLKDDTEIEVEPNHYVSVEVPANFVYGTGAMIDEARDRSYEYTGIIYPVSCDSNPDNISPQWQSERARRYDFYLNDGTITQFDQGDFVMVDSTQAPGLWICNREELFSGVQAGSVRIPFEEINKIEEQHFSILKTAFCMIGVVAGTFVALILAVLATHPRINVGG